MSDISKIVLESNNGTSPSSSNQKVVNDDATEAYEDDGLTNNPVQDRQFMEKYCVRGASKDTRYAIKQLQQSTLKDAQTFVNGVVDLAVEARFLSVVRHPNIIKMRAMGCGSPYDLKFFVVLDRLYDILTPRVVKWKQRTFKGVKKLMDRGGKKEMAFWLERMTVAYDLACALKYLHDVKYVLWLVGSLYIVNHSIFFLAHALEPFRFRSIIYRDLKPDKYVNAIHDVICVTCWTIGLTRILSLSLCFAFTVLVLTCAAMSRSLTLVWPRKSIPLSGTRTAFINSPQTPVRLATWRPKLPWVAPMTNQVRVFFVS